MKEYQAIVTACKPLTANVQALSFDIGEQAVVRPGQFLNISTGNEMNLLRRPIAICKAEGSEITVCFQIKGSGTASLAKAKRGDVLSVLLPLGNGFYASKREKKIALIGGGVGVFPMISCIRAYCEKKQVYSYIGFRNKDAVCMEEEIEKSTQYTIVTDDGSYGLHKNAVQAFADDFERNTPDVVFACGPTPMLKALQSFVAEKNIPCYLSLEERMGCGIGACLVCVCTLTGGEHARVCKDGPVFNAKEVLL